MYKISVPPERASDAITWASKNIEYGKFDVQFEPSNWQYIFEFNNSQSATLFTLKFA
jgi:hypothetical protein